MVMVVVYYSEEEREIEEASKRLVADRVDGDDR